MPLGVGGEPFEEVVVDLPEGALLALYTDGLVESRDHPLEEGLRGLREALADPVRPLEDVCDHVLNTLDTRHGEDDIALLMARVQGLPVDAVGDWQLPREARSVGRARELARAKLPAWGLEGLLDTTELLVSELVTNALRYGEGEIRLRLLLDRTLVCEVWDANLVQPRRRRARDTDEEAAASSSSACCRRAGAHAAPTAARRSGSNSRCPARHRRPWPNCRRSSC